MIAFTILTILLITSILIWNYIPNITKIPEVIKCWIFSLKNNSFNIIILKMLSIFYNLIEIHYLIKMTKFRLLIKWILRNIIIYLFLTINLIKILIKIFIFHNIILKNKKLNNTFHNKNNIIMFIIIYFRIHLHLN
jgi:hypothetical protein